MRWRPASRAVVSQSHASAARQRSGPCVFEGSLERSGQDAAVVDRNRRAYVVSGRWHQALRPSAAEPAQTLVVALLISEASAKVRSGGPKDDAEDHVLDVWAGVVPLALVAGAPIAASELREGIAIAAHALRYERPRRGEP